jgi:hypothetical protein
LSSAILYLAIVAIWLGVLVPRWLRPRQVVVRTADARQREDVTVAGPDTDSDTEPIPRVAPEHDHRALRPPARRPSARRGAVLQARRRMLIMITALAAGALGIAVTHMAAWWVVIPPGFMLGGFVVILREAARTDAERARRFAAGGARAAAGPVRPDAAEGAAAAEPVRAPAAEPAPARTAEIIDISARLGDQLYDQYADAAVRAVGD